MATMHSEPPAEAGGKIDLTDFQKLLHGLSSKQSVRHTKTKGAFGGVTKDERVVKALIRRLGK